MKPKALFCWSGGKDSALALYKISLEDKYEVAALLTTFNAEYKRVSMHGVREELLEKQAQSIGLPLLKVYVREGTNEEYERNMEGLLLEQQEKGISHVIFGDIFLEDLRAYRENNLRKVGLKALFPLWKQDTSILIQEFLAAGFRSITCCVNDAYLEEKHVGVELSTEYISKLPAKVDPCGENGEYHTFCFDGPLFREAVPVQIGNKLYRPLQVNTSNDGPPSATQGFWFCDLAIGSAV